jgi:hypothetical protein
VMRNAHIEHVFFGRTVPSKQFGQSKRYRLTAIDMRSMRPGRSQTVAATDDGTKAAAAAEAARVAVAGNRLPSGFADSWSCNSFRGCL